ncbi:putative adhesin [Terriglobus saanensis]|uniref:Putative adhesin Stv domain-containing protein n=1 Tax=Terriglobus saanensis (strain ATCC BAA-1853 / DSM 23119 / SP1PR4) TaxID=401053 RepID=E8UXC8_TERSS|nr:hypothetical protein [Terriglobus saanensis]ADV84152.1 hypothetical protein AciPR4_3398 [Terriglobus saanensis SP1PR4]
MARPSAGQVELGNYAYLIPSIGEPTSDYVVLAHGARVQGHTFFAPQGCTISYYAEQGSSYLMPAGPILEYRTRTQHRPTANHTVNFGFPAPDVVLGKILGRHWVDPLQAGGADHYSQLRREMVYSLHGNNAAWAPHVVVVRNRKWPHMNNEIWLSALVREIVKHKGPNVDIHLLSCLGLEQANRWRSGKQAYQDETSPEL